jgi:hypothetical protein
MSTGPKDKHHAPNREYTGRRELPTERETSPRSLLDASDAERLRIIEDVHRAAEAQGVSLGEELGRMMCGKNRDKRLKLAAWQCFLRDVLVKSDTSTGAPTRIPRIEDAAILPKRRPDPAKLIQLSQEKDDANEESGA